MDGATCPGCMATSWNGITWQVADNGRLRVYALTAQAALVRLREHTRGKGGEASPLPASDTAPFLIHITV